MSVPLTGSGGLMTRLGLLFGGLSDELALQGATATARVLSGASWQTRIANLETDYAASPSNLSLLAGDNGFGQSATPLNQIVNSWYNGQTSFFSNVQILAQNTLLKMADQDANGLVPRTWQNALTYLVNQMASLSETVNATTVSVGSQTSVGSPNGNPIMVASALNGKGQTLQYSFGETITFTVSQDAQSGNATLGQEALSVVGQAAASSIQSYQWPAGSGSSISLNAVSSSVNNSNGNVLQNSSFETYTSANTPDNWTVATGTAGTQVVAGGSANAYLGSNSVGFVGDSSTLTAITQLFSQNPSTSVGAGGTSYKPQPQTPYAVNGWLKLSVASPVAGVLEIALTDGNGNIQSDTSGNACSTTVTLTSIANTSWHNFNATFRLPAILPTQVKLRIRLSTALTTGTTVYIDAVSMNPMTTFYSGGPYISIFSGSSQMILNDQWTIAYTPTWGLFQQWFQRAFGINGLGLRLPSATSSPTVSDALIT